MSHHAPPPSNYHRARAPSMDMAGQTTTAAGAAWGQPYYPHPPANNYQSSHHQHHRHRHHHESAPLVFQSAHHHQQQQQQQQQQPLLAHHHHLHHSYPHQHQYSYQHPANYGYPPPPPPHQFFCHGQQHQYHHVTPQQHQHQHQHQSHHNARLTLEHQAQHHPTSSAVATAASTRPVLHRPNSGIQLIRSSSPKEMISSETNVNVFPANETASFIADSNENERKVSVDEDDAEEAKLADNVANKREEHEEQNEHEMMYMEESNEQENKLAAVDAIFAAAEVIAKRTTSPTSTATNLMPSNDIDSGHCKVGDTTTTSSEDVPTQTMPSSSSSSSSTTLDAIATANKNANDASDTSSTKNANDNIEEEQVSSPTCTKKLVITTPKPQRPMKKRKIVVVETNTPQSNHEKKEEDGISRCIMMAMKKPSPHSTLSSSSSSTTTATSPQEPQLGLPQTPKLAGAALFDNDQLLSSRALFLSQTIEEEPALYREILLHMALERETPRKPGGGAPDHHRRTKAGDYSSTASSGSSTSASVTSSSDEDGNALSSSSTSSSSLGSHPQISIGKRRGNQYVEGISVHTMMGGGDGVSGPHSKIITNGFFWKDVPELESILQKYMEEYYEMSENCPQSKNQQQFNNRLVSIIYSTALQCGYTFDPESFGCSDNGEAGSMNSSAPSTPTEETIGNPDGEAPQDAASTTSSSFNYKKLRDRIRCYYKTHVQNSKKRLITLLKNPSRPKNREVLIKIVEEVKDRANNSRGGGDLVGRRQLGTNGMAALRRLEEKERMLLCPNNSTSCLVTPSLGMTTPSARSGTLRDQDGGNRSVGVVPSSMCRSASSNCSSGVSSSICSSSGSSEKYGHESPPEWHAPPLTRRVPMHSMDTGHYDRCVSNTKVPQFASPCKPEHVAILTSIRQVPSRVLYTPPETLSSSA